MPSKAITEKCETCGGSGFSGYGTGYDAVCSDCVAGQRFVNWEETEKTEPCYDEALNFFEDLEIGCQPVTSLKTK